MMVIGTVFRSYRDQEQWILWVVGTVDNSISGMMVDYKCNRQTYIITAANCWHSWFMQLVWETSKVTLLTVIKREKYIFEGNESLIRRVRKPVCLAEHQEMRKSGKK